jgi:hypothetical protein
MSTSSGQTTCGAPMRLKLMTSTMIQTKQRGECSMLL